jgi:hypothetical protein
LKIATFLTIATRIRHTLPVLALAVMPAQAELIGYYTFEGNANDVSGNGNHGTLSANAPILTAAGGGFTGWGNASSQAYTFGAGSVYTDPNNSFITVPIDINPTVMPQVTFGAWVKTSNLDNVIRGIISHDDGGFDRTIDMDTRGGSPNVEFCAFTGVGGHCAADATTNWTFLVARYDAGTSTAQFTVNGTHSGVFTSTNGSGLTNTTIGRNPRFDLPFIGQIDNVFFYDEYLTDSQVNDIYRNGINPVPEPSTFALLAGGIALVAAGRRRR